MGLQVIISIVVLIITLVTKSHDPLSRAQDQTGGPSLRKSGEALEKLFAYSLIWSLGSSITEAPWSFGDRLTC